MENDRSYHEVHNFFDEPDLVREFALNQTYQNFVWNGNGYWSGYRTPTNNREIEFELFNKLEKIYGRKIQRMVSCFHLNPQNSMHGFPHADSDDINSFAGVVYLNKEFPDQMECGTTIYEDLPDYKNECGYYILNFNDKMEIVYDVTINPNNRFKHQFSRECLNFKNYVLKKVKTIEFEFNKLITYPGYRLHSPDFYFGNGKDSRLTVAFHGFFNAI